MHKQNRRALIPEAFQRPAPVVLCILLLGVCRLARADVKSCAAEHASGQHEVKAGHLKRAAELFAACGANEGCPSEIREECVTFYGDVERSVPTVVFSAQDEQGRDVTEVRVFEGELLLSPRLDGRPLPVDPGEHRFKFVFAGGIEATSEVLVRVGEKNRLVSARAEPQGTPPLGSVSGPELSTGVPASRRLTPAFWISTGVGAAALASWGAFALLGQDQQSKLGECSPNCGVNRRDTFDAMQRDYLIADISLGVAAVSAGLATWFYVSSRGTANVGDGRAYRSAGRVSVVPFLTGNLHTGPGAGVLVKTADF